MKLIWDWGNQIIVAIQTWHSPELDKFFNAVTFLGEAEFFLIFFPLIIWSIHKPTGVRLVYLVFISIALNTWAKLFFNHPRPFEWPSPADSPVLRLNHRALGPGLPSGHTQNSLVLWFYLAWHSRRRLMWLMAAGLFLLISFSRLYLGVHFPTDLLGGAFIGLLLLTGFLRLESWLTATLANLSRPQQLALAAGLPLGVMLIHPYPDIVAVTGLLCGFSLGLMVDQAALHFQANGSWQKRLTRYLLGMLTLLVVYGSFKFIMPPAGSPLHLPLTAARLIIAGFWISAGTPWLFLQIPRLNRYFCRWE